MSSAREESKAITDKKTKPHFIGRKSREVLLQEWFELWNKKPAFQKPDHKWIMQQKEKELLNQYGIKDPMNEWRKVFKPTKK